MRPAPGAFEKAREAAERSVEWLSQVRPEHLEGFWYNGTPNPNPLTIASRNNLVLLGTFITLLQAVAFTTNDRDALKKLWEALKWQLRIFSRGNELFEGALRRVDDKRMWVENVLEKGFTPISPVRQHFRDGFRGIPQPIPVVAEGTSIAGFPNFATQSMEDLLNAEDLIQQNVNAIPNFDDGFLGFEEFSGWDGFDINNMDQ